MTLRRVARSSFRIAGTVFLVVVATVALAVGGLWTFVTTERGSETVRRLALPRLNETIRGTAGLDRFRFHGDRIVLEGLTLRDPEGDLVGRVGKLEASFSPLDLVRGRVDVASIVVTRPELHLASGPRGSNLDRALAPRRQKPPAAPPRDRTETGERGPEIRIRELLVRDGAFHHRGGARAIDVVDLDGRAAVALDGPAASVEASLSARGARLEARAELNLETMRATGRGVRVNARGINLEKLIEDAPSSSFGFELRAKGGGRDLARLDGTLDFFLPPGRLDGQTIGPIGFSAKAKGERYEIANLRAALPGVAIDGHATVAKGALDGKVRVEARDLGALGRSLARRGGPPPVELAGSARVDLALEGTVARPTLRIAGQAPALRADANRVAALTFSAVVPNLRAPDAADLDLAAASAVLGDRPLRGVSLVVRSAGEHLSLRGRIAGPQPLQVDASGRREPATGAISLAALAVRYPEASWSLVRPARIAYGEGRLSIEGLALQSGDQRISVDLARTPRTQRGRVVIARFDLGRLPRSVSPAALGLGGIVDLDARLAGTPAAPELDAKVSLAGGRVRRYRDLSLALDARYARRRAEGQLAAKGLGTAVAARFDLPAAWPPPSRQSPFQLELDLEETEIAAVMKALREAGGAGPEAAGKVVRKKAAPEAPLQGRVRLTARLGGTTARPTLAVDVTARKLVVESAEAGRQPLGDVDLRLRGEGDRPLVADLGVVVPEAAAARTAIRLETPLSLARLLRRPPTGDALARTPFQLQGDVDRLPIALLARFAGYRLPVGGTLSSKIALSGTALDPRGTLTADVSGATSGRFPPTDARLELDLDARKTAARARIVRKGRPLLAAIVEVGAPPGALANRARLADAPIKVRAVLGPLALQRLGLPPESDRDPPRALKGRLHADLTVDGTLRAPRIVAHAHADDIRLDKALVGVGKLALTYADRKAALEAHLRSTNGGTLRATAKTTIEIGYPALTAAPDLRKLPLDVRIDAQRFDIQGLSGVTERLRTVAGFIDAAATVRGTPADPQIEGRLAWTKGTVAITGMGEYKDIELALRGSDENLTLENLSAKSGSGSARLTGDGRHVAGTGYRFTARAKLDEFPIYQEGQPLADVSLEANLRGSAAPLVTRVSVDIAESRVALSDAKRKDLQDLKAPPDVILMQDGEPLNRAQAEKLKALRLDEDDGLAAEAKAKAAATARAERQSTERDDGQGVRVRVNAERRVWVTGKDAYLELGLSPNFRVWSNEETQVFGQVMVRRGRIDLFGRRFDLKSDSTVQFTGPPDRPVLDVRAQHQNEKEDVTVLLTAKGPLDRLTVTVTSPNRPELTESQLYTLIITGRLQLGGGGTAGGASPTAQAASLLGGVLAAQLQKALADKLPLDVLTIDAGSEGVRGTRLEAGRYVTSKLYVGYVGRVGADPFRYQNRNAVHVEYQLSSRWQLDAEYGDVGTGTLDLMWRKNY